MAAAETDPRGPQFEFYAPFAHVPGRYEWCRIRSPSHGVFDTFIVLGATTAQPATVYVNAALGAAFMAERFPECTTVRVAAGDLRIQEGPTGRAVHGTLRSETGPVTKADMELEAPEAALPKAVAYGGDGQPVWGSRYTCWGVDLVLEARVRGHVVRDGVREELTGAPGIVTLGSFGDLRLR